ncbi:ATP-binding protein [Kocuria coralli]|uniref:ATP-binding protein n=1 Tax=Kocuria coralli TaxID=1461025 RepID=A0A5J5KY12_9MICC|nr:AAA family ATPase [Kocuria coralli]KAA9394563.1 ATP-binding protein [Kocuria coralli]
MDTDREPSRRGHVVWINGAFGAGKTTVARRLAQAVPGAVIVDPEEVGSILRQALQPVSPVHDFQEWAAWRELVAATLNAVVHQLPETGPRMVIVPQTITDEAYWSQITASLDPEFQVTAIALHVDRDEHRRRVLEDTDEPGALRWRLGKFEHFREATWVRAAFTGIETSALTPAEVVDKLYAALGSEQASS